MKMICLPFFVSLLVISCKKDKVPEPIGNPDDASQVYFDYKPDIVLNPGDSILIDIDNNGVNDVKFSSDGNIYQINDSVLISVGKFIGSGSGNLDTIAYNEIINMTSQTWYLGMALVYQDLNYIGVSKDNGISSTFGWIKVKIEFSTITIDSYFFSKQPDKTIRAGKSVY